MANASRKARAAQNKKVLHRHSIAILVAVILSILLRILRRNLFSLSSVFLNITCFVLYYIAYYVMIYKPAKPVYEGNDLVHGGQDLNIKGGFVEYSFDTLYINMFVQVVSAWTMWIAMLFIAIPIFLIARYFSTIKMLLGMLLGRGGGQGAADPEDDARGKRRREKAERRATRVKYRNVR